VQDGPGLYCGLPGLILDLEDGQTIYSCTAINTNSTREVEKPKRAKVVTAEEFEELRKREFSR
jgi:GLPGLI family protein